MESPTKPEIRTTNHKEKLRKSKKFSMREGKIAEVKKKNKTRREKRGFTKAHS